MTRIDLHIDRLVLEGVDARHAQSIRDALQLHLEQRIQAGSLPDRLRADVTRDVLDGGSITIALNARPAAWGDALAGAVWRGVSG